MAGYQLNLDDVSDQNEGYKPTLDDFSTPAQQNAIPNNMPYFIKAALGLLGSPSMAQSTGENIAQHAKAAGQGVLDIGQGIRQLGTSLGESAGVLPKGSTKDYTEMTDAERAEYAKTPQGRDYLSQLIRGGTSDLPYLAIGAPMGLESTLARLGAGAAMGAAVGSTKYVPENKSRAQNVVEGAGLGIIPETPGIAIGALKKAEGGGKLASNFIKGLPATVKNAFSNMEPLESSVSEATKVADEATAGHEAVQRESQGITGSTTPGSLEYKKNNAISKLNELDELSNNPSVSPEQLQQAKVEADQAMKDHLTAQSAAKIETGVETEHGLQSKVVKAKADIDALNQAFAKNPAVSPQDVEAHKAILAHAQKAYEDAKSEAASTVGVSGPDALQYKLNQHNDKIDQIDNALATHQETQAPDTNETAANVEAAQSAHKEATDLADQADKNLDTELRPKAQHDVKAAGRVSKIQGDTQSEISQGYKDLEEEFSDKNVKVNNEDEIKAATEKLAAFEKSYLRDTSYGNKIKDELSAIQNKKGINAGDYLRALRSVKKQAFEARSKAYQPGMDAEARAEWKQKYDELDDTVEEMSKALENGVGKENYDKLVKLNGRWRNEVTPLYRNTTFQHIKKFGRFPSANITHSLRGNETGNNLIKGIIKNDPEALKNVIGQRYAVKPSEIHSPNETMQEYLEKAPDIKQMADQHNQTQNAVDEASQRVKETQKTHNEATNLAKQAEKSRVDRENLQQERQKTAEKANLLQKFKENVTKTQQAKSAAEENVTQVKQAAAESQKLQDQISKAQEFIPVAEKHLATLRQLGIHKNMKLAEYKELARKAKSDETVKQKLLSDKAGLEEDIKNYDKYIPMLDQSASAKDVSLQEKSRRMADLAKAKEKRQQAQWALSKLVGLGFGVYGVKKIFNTVSSISSAGSDEGNQEGGE